MTNRALMSLVHRKLTAATVLLFAYLGLLALAAPASASTFCVPVYTAACPNNGTNIEKSNLETAINTNSSDGHPDTVLIGVHEYVDPDTLEPIGTDPVEIIGSGTDKTTITSSDSGNQYVANLSFDHRPVSMSNLTIVVPASFSDNGGAGVQAQDGVFDHVDIKVLNDGSDGAPSLSGDLTWKNSRIYAAEGGSVGFGIQNNNSKEGRLEITNTTIVDPVWGIVVEDARVPTIVKQSRIISPIGYGVFVSRGGLFVMENSIISGSGLEAIEAQTLSNADETDVSVAVRASTLIAENAPNTAAIKLFIKKDHSIDFDVTDTIISGYENTWDMATPDGPGFGHGKLTLTRSNFKPAGLPAGFEANVDHSDPGNTAADPQLNDDLTLQPSSPLIDAGTPSDTGNTVDYAGNARPQDGNGDGIALRDIGAFEAAKLPTCRNTPSLCPVVTPPDTVAPKLSKVKFKAAKGKKKTDTIKLTLSEAAKVKAAFKPVGKGKKKRKAYRLNKAGKTGANTFKFKRKKLKPGRYKLAITATDAAGNRSKTLIRKIRVK